jgi:hypothetical protein
MDPLIRWDSVAAVPSALEVDPNMSIFNHDKTIPLHPFAGLLLAELTIC